jgi:hypothetical protein
MNQIAEAALQAIDFYDSSADMSDQQVESHLALNAFLIHYVATLRGVSPEDIAGHMRVTSFSVSTRGSEQPFMVPPAPIVLALDAFQGAPDAFEASLYRLFDGARDLNTTLLRIAGRMLKVSDDQAAQVVRQDLNRITKEVS